MIGFTNRAFAAPLTGRLRHRRAADTCGRCRRGRGRRSGAGGRGAISPSAETTILRLPGPMREAFIADVGRAAPARLGAYGSGCQHGAAGDGHGSDCQLVHDRTLT